MKNLRLSIDNNIFLVEHNSTQIIVCSQSGRLLYPIWMFPIHIMMSSLFLLLLFVVVVILQRCRSFNNNGSCCLTALTLYSENIQMRITWERCINVLRAILFPYCLIICSQIVNLLLANNRTNHYNTQRQWHLLIVTETFMLCVYFASHAIKQRYGEMHFSSCFVTFCSVLLFSWFLFSVLKMSNSICSFKVNNSRFSI